MPRLTQELQFPNQSTNPKAPYNGVAVFCKDGSLYTIDSNGIVALIRTGSEEHVDLSNYYTINETDNAISTAINALINGAPGTLDTLKELADAVNSNKSLVDALNEAISNKQDTLVSGTNIKTINGESILGTGDITISSGTENAIPITGSSSLSGTFEPSVNLGANLGSKNKRFGNIYADNLGLNETIISNIYIGTTIRPTDNKKGSVYLGTDGNWFGGIYLGSPNSSFAGQLLPPGTMSQVKTWELPNASGTIALTSDIPENPILSGVNEPQTINGPFTILDTLEVNIGANDINHLTLKDSMHRNIFGIRVESDPSINDGRYTLSLPLKSGTLATLDDIQSSGGSSGSGIQIFEQMPAPGEVTDGQVIAMPTTDAAVVDVVYNANASSYSSGTVMNSGSTKTYNSTIGAKNYWMITYTYSGSYTNTLIVPCTGNDFYGFHYSSSSTYLRCNATTDGKSITLYNTGETIYIHAVMAF